MKNNHYYQQSNSAFRFGALALCVLLLTLSFAINVAFATPGKLDLSFDLNGKLRTDFAGQKDTAYGVAVQPDGKIVVVGTIYIGDEGYIDFGVARYNPNGSFDTSFGDTNGFGLGAGRTRIDFGSSNDVARAVKILSNGKILIAGTSNVGDGGSQNFAVVRLNSNGDVDTTFGTNGRVRIDFGSTASPRVDTCNAMVVQSNGKIVLAGSTSAGGGGEFEDPSADLAVARLNADGTLDNTFDLNGKLRTDYAGQEDKAYSVALQNNGKIVVAGLVTFGASSDFVVARYNSNGSLDTTFREPDFSTDRSGFVRFDFGAFGSGASTNSVARAVKVQSDGKIVVAGTSNANSPNPGQSDFALRRLNVNGDIDDTFFTFFPGSGVQTDFGTQTELSLDEAYAIEIQPDGKVLVAGTTKLGNGNHDFALARYNSNGSLDNTFDLNGKLKTDLSANFDAAYAIALQPDGKVVLAGEGFFSDSGSFDFALARYLAQ